MRIARQKSGLEAIRQEIVFMHGQLTKNRPLGYLGCRAQISQIIEQMCIFSRLVGHFIIYSIQFMSIDDNKKKS